MLEKLMISSSYGLSRERSFVVAGCGEGCGRMRGEAQQI